MIGYVTLGTNDREKAVKYYDDLLGEIGVGRIMKEDHFDAWGTTFGEPMFLIMNPFNEEPATVGNGVMVALYMDNREKVDALYKKAMELGSQDEGAPGPRADENFYGAYFRDMDGNKLCAFHMTMPG